MKIHLISFVLILFIFTFLALGLAHGQTATTTNQNVPSANDVTASTASNTTKTTETVTTFTDSNGVVHHAYNITLLMPITISFSASASVSSVITVPPHDADLNGSHDWILDYLSLEYAGIMLGVISGFIMYCNLPHPVKTSKVN